MNEYEYKLASQKQEAKENREFAITFGGLFLLFLLFAFFFMSKRSESSSSDQKQNPLECQRESIPVYQNQESATQVTQ